MLLVSCAPAQAQISVESRLIRLENEVAALRSQLSQTTVNRPVPRVNPATPALPRSNRTVTSNDPQFDRLATLVIELKERINKLEAQVDKLNRR